MREEVLEGGNASGPVVRVGDTVRKAWTAATPHIVAYVRAMRDGGVDAPEPLGRDAQGRQIIEFIPGALAMDAAPLSAAELGRVGDMVRWIHDVSARYVPAADAIWEPPLSAPAQELICHNDLAPWNLMLGDRWVFIDWDGASPSTRSWDLAFSAQTFALPDPTSDPERSADDLAAFVDGYGADEELRAVLPDMMRRRTQAMLDLLRSSAEAGREPWGTMYSTGHGAHWAAVLDYVTAHRGVWQRALA
ncbi:phosphotransferase [Microbacterium paraoxydans]|uniref:Phosphotransferase enzyme family protein n=1 Tax=Microbacterium paraoxydans TaxID=199592 RepID=A0A1H1UP86_9MICO|nr:phosphotransferase [Microbacterium paraoxydans]SDS74348.1 Phosphotransferase enzyme family protein [Microbacterium paraoxydans]